MPKGQKIKQTIDYFVYCTASATNRTFQHKRDMEAYMKRHAKVCKCGENQILSYETAGKGIEATKLYVMDEIKSNI